MSVNYSFYVPRMATTHGEDSVRAAFRFLGNVKRADFVPIEGDDRFQKAFVHMDHIIESDTNSEIMNRVFGSLFVVAGSLLALFKRSA